MTARRASTSYGDASAAPVAVPGALSVERPAEGFYRMKLRSGGVYGGVRVVYGPPLDPVTREELDRSWRWYALFNDDPVELDDVWPQCGRDPISEQEYRDYCRRQSWARDHAPGSAYSNPKKRIDPLDRQNPLPF